MSQTLTVTLTDEQSRMISEKVKAGEYTSADDLIGAALDNLAVQCEPSWMPPDSVVRALIDEALEDPRSFTPAEVHEHLLQHHRQRLAEDRLTKDRSAIAR